MKNIFVPLLSVLLFAGCAPKEFVDLPSETKNRIKKTKLYVLEPTTNIIAEINVSNVSGALGGGLIGGLIDAGINSSRRNDAIKALQPIQRNFQNHDIKKQLITPLAKSLAKENWVNFSGINQVGLDQFKSKRLILDADADADVDGVFFIQFYYRLSPDFTQLIGSLYVTLYPAQLTMKDKENDGSEESAIFKFNKTSRAHVLENKGCIEENAKIWAENDSESFKNGLQKIIDDLMEQLEYNFHNCDRVTKLK